MRLEILHGHRGDELPWQRANQAIAQKKSEWMTQIEALQQVHAGLVAFEGSLEQARCQYQFSRLVKTGTARTR